MGGSGASCALETAVRDLTMTALTEKRKEEEGNVMRMWKKLQPSLCNTRTKQKGLCRK